MVEHADCHRTGFSEEELAAHVAAGPCAPLSPRSLREHYRYDSKDDAGLLECGTKPPSQAESEEALMKRIADLERVVAAMVASGDPGVEAGDEKKVAAAVKGGAAAKGAA